MRYSDDECMSEALKVPAGDDAMDVANIDEFYVRRINWLVTIGRTDLIDEIADDCERRRTAPSAVADASASADVELINSTPEPRPRPVEAGTQQAVARLRRSHRRVASFARL